MPFSEIQRAVRGAGLGLKVKYGHNKLKDGPVKAKLSVVYVYDSVIQRKGLHWPEIHKFRNLIHVDII